MKKMIFVSLGTVMLLAQSNFMVVAHADEADSKATLELKPTTGPTEPVKPIEPAEPGGEETGNAGPLSIDYVTNFNFGEHELETSQIVYNLEDKPTNANVQVTDNRGTGDGWTLQVSLSEFTTAEKVTLKGAELALPVREVKSVIGNISNAPDFEKDMVLTPGSLQTLMSAKEEAGMGTWAAMYDSENIALSVPSGNHSGQYEAKLTWTLADVPAK